MNVNTATRPRFVELKEEDFTDKGIIQRLRLYGLILRGSGLVAEEVFTGRCRALNALIDELQTDHEQPIITSIRQQIKRLPSIYEEVLFLYDLFDLADRIKNLVRVQESRDFEFGRLNRLQEQRPPLYEKKAFANWRGRFLYANKRYAFEKRQEEEAYKLFAITDCNVRLWATVLTA